MVFNRHLKWVFTYNLILFNFHKYHQLLLSAKYTQRRNGPLVLWPIQPGPTLAGVHTRVGGRGCGIPRFPHYNSQKTPRSGGRFHACVPAPRSVLGDVGALPPCLGAQCAWREPRVRLQGWVSWSGSCFGKALSVCTACWVYHEAPRFGAAENAVCICDGGERGAFHQKGASGTEVCGPRGAAALGPPDAWEPPCKPGAFLQVSPGKSRRRGVSTPWSPASLYLVSCKGGNLREKFSDEAIQTCRRMGIENPHLK